MPYKNLKDGCDCGLCCLNRQRKYKRGLERRRERRAEARASGLPDPYREKPENLKRQYERRKERLRTDPVYRKHFNAVQRVYYAKKGKALIRSAHFFGPGSRKTLGPEAKIVIQLYQKLRKELYEKR